MAASGNSGARKSPGKLVRSGFTISTDTHRRGGIGDDFPMRQPCLPRGIRSPAGPTLPISDAGQRPAWEHPFRPALLALLQLLQSVLAGIYREFWCRTQASCGRALHRTAPLHSCCLNVRSPSSALVEAPPQISARENSRRFANSTSNRYVTVEIARKVKNGAGRAVNPRRSARNE